MKNRIEIALGLLGRIRAYLYPLIIQVPSRRDIYLTILNVVIITNRK